MMKFVNEKDDIPIYEMENKIHVWNHQPVSIAWPKGLISSFFAVGMSFGLGIWLVVDLPLWKLWKSVGMMTFPIWWEK